MGPSLLLSGVGAPSTILPAEGDVRLAAGQSQSLAAPFDAAILDNQGARQPDLNGIALPSGPTQSPLARLGEEAQKLIDIGNAITRPQPKTAALAGQAPQGAVPGIGGQGAGIDLTALNRAYDFAMRTYLLSKVASEVSSGLRSLWQAQ